MTHKSPLIYCAIDTDNLAHACDLARQIGPITSGLKLGLELFSRFGPQGVEKVRESCSGADLFLDMKYHDIPNTVAGAVRAISKNLAPAYLNVHAGGGLAMMGAAKEACAPQTKLLAVTILTSLDEAAIDAVGYQGGVTQSVSRLAQLTQKSGLDGIVCSAHEIQMIREKCGADFALMVPGIRPAGSDTGDQKRVMTQKQALDADATHLVIGRPITQAPDPRAAAQAILDDMESQ